MTQAQRMNLTPAIQHGKMVDDAGRFRSKPRWWVGNECVGGFRQLTNLAPLRWHTRISFRRGQKSPVSGANQKTFATSANFSNETNALQYSVSCRLLLSRFGRSSQSVARTRQRVRWRFFANHEGWQISVSTRSELVAYSSVCLE